MSLNLPAFRLRQRAPLVLAVALALSAIPASANPTNPAVVNGQVTINQAGNLLSITNSPNSIINWQSFSIGAGEITRFTQQSAASAVLNRVVGAGGAIDPSVILGALQSNGRVFLLNPSGIVFGAGAQIDVAGLVASSLNLSNADFLGGRLRFSEVPGAGSVVNQGTINAATGGQVYLVGPSVTNSGLITSPKGEVILAAGNSVELVSPGTPGLRVEITAPDNEAKNLGSIIADAGRVGIYAGLINHSGTIRADSAVWEAGRILLKATKNINLAAGSVTTSNSPAGGSIEIEAGDSLSVAGSVAAKAVSGMTGLSGISLIADNMDLQGTIDAGAGNIHVRPTSSGRSMDLGGGSGGGLSLTQAEIDKLITTGHIAFGDHSAGGPLTVSATFDAGTADVWFGSGSAITVNAPLNLGGSLEMVGGDIVTNAAISVGSVSASGNNIAINAPLSATGDAIFGGSGITTNAALAIGGNALLYGTAIATNAPITVSGNLSEQAGTISHAAAINVGGTLDVNTTSLAINAPIVGQRVALATDSLMLTETVNAVTDIEITRDRNWLGGMIEVGGATAGPHNILYLTGTQVNTLLKAPTLRIGGDKIFTINVIGALAPAGADAPGSVILQTARFSTIDVKAPISTSMPGDIQLSGENVNVSAGGSLTTHSGSISISGNTTIAGPLTATSGSINITGRTLRATAPMLANSGGINLIVDDPIIDGLVRTTGVGSDINIRPLGFPPMIALGGAGTYLDSLELGLLSPGSGVLRVGDMDTARISIVGPIADMGPHGITTLSLIAGNGDVRQTLGSTISVSNLAVSARDGIALYEGNAASTISLHSRNGDVGYRYAGAGPLTIGTVDPAFVPSGVSAHTEGNVTLRSNEISINENVTGKTVSLAPYTLGTAIALGAKPGTGTLGVTAEELDRIHASTLAVGDIATGDVTVTAPISAGTFSNLSVLTLPSASFVVDGSSALSVPGNITISTGAVTTNSTISAVNGDIRVSADAMTFAAAVNADASSGTISLAQRNAATAIDLGGADVASATGKLGLDATDIGNLRAAKLEIGNASTASITVSAPTHLDASSATLTTRMGGAINVNEALDNRGDLSLISLVSAGTGLGDGPINVNGPLSSVEGSLILYSGGSIVANGPLSSAGALSLTSNRGSITVNGALSALLDTTLSAHGIMIPGGSISGANVTLHTAGGSAVLGTPAPGADLFLSQEALDRIVTPGTLTVDAWSLDVTAPVSVTSAANLTLRATSMDIGSTITLNGAGKAISVEPRFAGEMRLGTDTPIGVFSQLLLSDAEINRFIVPGGVLRLGGDAASWGGTSVEGAISIDPARVGVLALRAGRGGIGQLAGATITAANLRLETSGVIDLAENNNVGTLSGGNSDRFSNYAFTTAGTLTIGGMVDGVAGLHGGNLTLKADDLVLIGPGTISNAFVNAGPRLPGAGMNLGGSSAGGRFSVDSAELSRFTGETVSFGVGTAGPVTVSAPMERSSGSLGIWAAPDQTVEVAGILSAPSGVYIDAGTINISQPITSSSGSIDLTARSPATLDISAPVTAATYVGLYSDSVHIGATVTGNAVTIGPVTTGRRISLGLESADALSLTQAELVQISTHALEIGGRHIYDPTSGSIVISRPLELNVDSLALAAIGAITQAPDAPITLLGVDISGQRVGNLDARTFGNGIGNASIFLPAENEVPGTLSFRTRGTHNDFTFGFAATTPPGSIVNLGVSGKAVIGIGPLAQEPVVPSPNPEISQTPQPPAPGSATAAVTFSLAGSTQAGRTQAQLVTAVDAIAGINHALVTTGVEDLEKKAEEEQ